MQLTVGTEPVQVPGSGDRILAICNMGPGILYWDLDDSVSEDTGIPIAIGGVYETPDEPDLFGRIFLVSDTADTDVRYVGG